MVWDTSKFPIEINNEIKWNSIKLIFHEVIFCRSWVYEFCLFLPFSHFLRLFFLSTVTKFDYSKTVKVFWFLSFLSKKISTGIVYHLKQKRTFYLKHKTMFPYFCLKHSYYLLFEITFSWNIGYRWNRKVWNT